MLFSLGGADDAALDPLIGKASKTSKSKGVSQDSNKSSYENCAVEYLDDSGDEGQGLQHWCS